MPVLRKTRLTLPIRYVVTLSSAPAAADFDAGVEANRNGDYQTAFTEIREAALGSDNRAYGKLGSMYLYGLGTEKDYHQAYVWFHMAHLSGEREAERFRDAASSMLSREAYASAVQAAEEQGIALDLEQTPQQ